MRLVLFIIYELIFVDVNVLADVWILAAWKCAWVSTMQAASTHPRRGATSSTLWVFFQCYFDPDVIATKYCDVLWISSGVEDCPPPSVWCKAPQRRHCCDDHNQSYWWETFCFSVFVVFNKNVVDFLPHAIVFFTRPAAPICLPRLFPFLSTTVWLCL